MGLVQERSASALRTVRTTNTASRRWIDFVIPASAAAGAFCAVIWVCGGPVVVAGWGGREAFAALEPRSV